MFDKAILVVDDEQDLLAVTRSIFESAGYKQIITAASAREALHLISKKMPDMIILDIMMPEMDGFALLQEIRAVSNVPVMLLTARGEAEDKFAGFELGADDYLVKPFLPKELLLRVQAILRRAHPEKNRIITLDSCMVDLDQAEVIKDGQHIPLTAKEYCIFEKLSDNIDHIVTIGLLCQAICGEIWQGYEKTLMTHIRHIREKIEKDPSEPVSLLTVKGLGYKLVSKGANK